MFHSCDRPPFDLNSMSLTTVSHNVGTANNCVVKSGHWWQSFCLWSLEMDLNRCDGKMPVACDAQASSWQSFCLYIYIYVSIWVVKWNVVTVFCYLHMASCGQGAPWSSPSPPSPRPWRCRRLRCLEIFGLGQPAIAAGGGAWHVGRGGVLPTQRSISYSIQVMQDYAGIHIYVNVGRKINMIRFSSSNVFLR